MKRNIYLKLRSKLILVLCLAIIMASISVNSKADTTQFAELQGHGLFYGLEKEENGYNVVRFSIKVVNSGRDMTDESGFAVSFTLDGDSKTTYTSLFDEPLGSGQQVEAVMDVSWKVKSGDHVVTVNVDAQNQVTESNESNNTVTFKFNVPKAKTPAKVAVFRCEINPRSAIEGKYATFTIVIRNEGGMEIKPNTPIYVGITVRGNKKETKLKPIIYKGGVKPGQQVDLKVKWKATSKGLYLYTATLANSKAFLIDKTQQSKKCYFDVE